MTEDKKTLIIEGKEVEFTNEPNLLEVIRKAGMNVPTLCYRPDLTSFGACRLCVVEVEYPNGRRVINSSCTMPPETNIKVYLNTEKTRKIRKMVLELLLANHDRECTTCDKSGSCELQQYAEEYGIKDVKKYAQKDDLKDVDDSSYAIVRATKLIGEYPSYAYYPGRDIAVRRKVAKSDRSTRLRTHYKRPRIGTYRLVIFSYSRRRP